MSNMARKIPDIVDPLDFVAGFEAALSDLIEGELSTLSPFNKEIFGAAYSEVLSNRNFQALRHALELQMKSPQNSRDRAKLEQFLVWKFKTFVTGALYPLFYRAAMRMDLNREEFIGRFFNNLNGLVRSYGISIQAIEEDEAFAREMKILYGKSPDAGLMGRPHTRRRPKIVVALSLSSLGIGDVVKNERADFEIEPADADRSGDIVPFDTFLVDRAAVSAPTPVIVERTVSRGKILQILFAAGLLLAARHCASDSPPHDEASANSVVKGHMVYNGE